MSNEIDKVANDDNRELAITNIKKSPYLTRQGKEVAMNIISDTMLHEARKRSENHMNKIKVETVVEKSPEFKMFYPHYPM